MCIFLPGVVGMISVISAIYLLYGMYYLTVDFDSLYGGDFNLIDLDVSGLDALQNKLYS